MSGVGDCTLHGNARNARRTLRLEGVLAGLGEVGSSWDNDGQSCRAAASRQSQVSNPARHGPREDRSRLRWRHGRTPRGTGNTVALGARNAVRVGRYSRSFGCRAGPRSGDARTKITDPVAEDPDRVARPTPWRVRQRETLPSISKWLSGRRHISRAGKADA